MKISKRTQQVLPGILLYSLVFIRYVYYGFRYFYQLDDYIQYHNYTYFYDDLWNFVAEMGMLSSRPAAGPADVFVWSRFFPCMIVAVAVLAAMYTAAGVLLYRIFQKYFRVTWLFPVLFALLPLGFEGTYWVSASSRVVCGLFFCVLGAWFLERYWDRGRWYLLLPAMLLEFFGSCFYEQALVFGVALFCLLALLRLRTKEKRALWGGFSLVNAVLYFVLTSLMPSGPLYSGRMGLVLPTSPDYFKVFLPNIWRQLKGVFQGGGFATVFKGFRRGCAIVAQDGAVLFLLALVLLAVAFGIACYRDRRETEQGKLLPALLVGLLLALAPLAPFLVIANPWFSFRGAVASFGGIALGVDALTAALWSRVKGGRLAAPAVAAAVAAVFCIAGVSELHDYRQTYQDDHKAADTVLAQLDLSDSAQRIGLLGLEKTYLTDQNWAHHEHIHGTTESGWAFTALLEYKTKNKEIATVIPLHADCIYQEWNYEDNRLDGFDRLYYYDHTAGTLTLLRCEEVAARRFALYTEEGALFGHVEEKNGEARLVR